MPIGGGRKICAHIEWPYSAARRCLPLGQQRAAARATTTAAERQRRHHAGGAEGQRRHRDPRHDRQGRLAGPGRGLRPRLPAADRQHVPEPAVGAGGRQQARAGRRGELRVHGSEDVRLQAQAGPEVLERRPADVRGRQVLARPQLKIADPSGPSSLLALAGLGRGDRPDDRDDEPQEGRRARGPSSSPTTSRRSCPTRSTRPTRSSPTTRSIGSGPYKLDKYTPEPAGRVLGRTRTTPARTRRRRRTSSSSTSSRLRR